MKRLIKHVGIVILKSLGILRLSRAITLKKGFLVIGWHGVSLDDEHTRFKTLFISPQQFDDRLRFLAKTLRIVSLEEALTQHASGHINSRQVVLTFDDGYFNFLEKAVPILDRHDAPSVNYIVSNRMLDGRSKPNMILRDVIARTTVEAIASNSLKISSALPLNNEKEKKKAERALLGVLNSLAETEKDQYVDQVANVLKVDVEALRAARYWACMSTNEVHELANRSSRHSLQLHTHKHINVLDLGDDIDNDLATCRSQIEGATKLPAKDFCYPTGLWAKSVWPALKLAGIRSAVTTKRGPNFVDTNALSLRRVMDGGANSQLEFELEVSGLKWLIHSIIHPSSRDNPGEKIVRYGDDPNPY